MTKLEWDKVGERKYETGASNGVLYSPDANGLFPAGSGVPWNGLTAVTESPSGAESTKVYADNIAYLNLISAEDYNATIEALMSPPEFDKHDGTASPAPGLTIGQQARKPFGFSWQTRIGNDLQAQDYGYKIHIVYGATAAPSEKNYATINDTPEAMPLSWELSTTPVNVPGFKPSAKLTLDSTKIPANVMTQIQDILYGTAGIDARLPQPSEIIQLLAGTSTEVVPTAPTATAAGVITIPSVTGVRYRRADTGAVVTNAATVQIPGGVGSSLIITAEAVDGTYRFKAGEDDDWKFTKTA